MRPGDMRPGDMRDVRWICLRGNHEDTLLNFLADPEEYGPRWLANGGLATISSYVGEPVESLMPQGRNWDRHTLMLLRDALAAALPTAHRSFLEALPSYHMEGDFLFVHAGLRPGIALADQTIRDLLWIRHDFLGSEIDHGPMIVHGHTIAAAPDVQANRIGVDTGAYASGHLTALVLEGHSLHFLTT